MVSENRKLPPRVIAASTFSSLATNCLWMLNNYFLLYYYTDVIQIPAASATVILLIARVWDAVNDPMMGVLCDRTRSPEGKSRFWMKRIALPAGIFIALSYICPGFDTAGKVIWAGIFYILQGMAQTAIGVPSASLTISLTSDRTERVRLAQYTAVASAAANFLVPALTMPFVRMVSSDMQIGFGIIAAAIGLLYAISSFLVYRATKGMDPDTSLAGGSSDAPQISFSFRPILEALKNRYAMLVSLAFFCYLLLSGLMGSTLIYYFTYNLNNAGLMSLYSGAALAGMFGAILTMRAVSRKLGNAGTCIFGGLVCAAAMIPRILTGDRYLPVFAVCMVLLGLGSGYLSQMIHQCKMDSAAYGALHGHDNQSVIVSLFTFFQKFGQAFSSVIGAALLALFHYTSGEVPTESVLKLFYAENLILPLAIAAAVIAILSAVRRMEKEMLQELEQGQAA